MGLLEKAEKIWDASLDGALKLLGALLIVSVLLWVATGPIKAGVHYFQNSPKFLEGFIESPTAMIAFREARTPWGPWGDRKSVLFFPDSVATIDDLSSGDNASSMPLRSIHEIQIVDGLVWNGVVIVDRLGEKHRFYYQSDEKSRAIAAHVSTHYSGWVIQSKKDSAPKKILGQFFDQSIMAAGKGG